MYEELFKSPARPFRATPDPKFYFPHDSIALARQTAIRAVQRAEGPVMVLGGAGLGKSLLGEILSNDLCEQFDVVKLQSARLCSRKALLQNILFELNLPYRDLSEGELRLSILDRLEPAQDCAPEGILFVVDEAHTLPAKLLEELRLITNFTRRGQPRARLVLIGGMQLEDTFTHPQMESFNQRLAARCYLTPMTRDQTRQYVAHQILSAGHKPADCITNDGLDSVYSASEGVPRLANQIMDHALVLAFTNGHGPISASLIEEAWADLQQLPAPWVSAADKQQGRAVSDVEFGSLDDDGDQVSFDSEASSDFIAFEPEAVATEPATGDMTSDATSTMESLSTQSPTSEAFGDPNVAVFEAPTGFEIDDQTLAAFDTGICEPPNEAFQSADNGLIQVEFGPVEDETWSDEIFVNESAAQSIRGDSDESTRESFLGADSFENAESIENSNSIEKAVESLESPFVKPTANFFAAFSVPTDDEIPELFDTPESNDKLPDPVAEQLTRPQLVFNASNSFKSAQSKQTPADAPRPETLPTDSFFMDRPTDEQLIALIDEQDQYDSMGVWENDPPIASDGNDSSVPTNAMPAEVGIRTDANPTDLTSKGEEVPELQRNISPSELFGDDFDEEVCIGEPMLRSRIEENRSSIDRQSAHSQIERPASANAVSLENREVARASLTEKQKDAPETVAFPTAEQPDSVESKELVVVLTAAEAREQVEEIQQFADNLSLPQAKPLTRDSGAQEVWSPESEGRVQLAELSESAGPWSMDVASVDVASELAVQNAIEDIVSQLNFSAFVTESFSIEHINMEPQQSSEKIPVDSIRSGKDNEIYMMHRADEPREDSIFSDATARYDDDRDMLIIEEELAVSKPRTESADHHSTTKTTPYNQLFAKLRK